MDWVAVGALALGSTILLGALELAPRDPARGVAVVFPPWVGSADAMSRAAAAGAAIVQKGRYAFIVIARPRSQTYIRDVLAEGALLVLEPAALGCVGRRGSI